MAAAQSCTRQAALKAGGPFSLSKQAAHSASLGSARVGDGGATKRPGTQKRYRCLLECLAGDGGVTKLIADKAEMRDIRDGTVYLVGGISVPCLYISFGS